MKVLLILANKHLGWCLSRSILIWFTTCLVGTVAFYAIVYEFPPVEALGLSLIFSSPVMLLCVPSLYALPAFKTILARFLFSLLAIITGCTIIIGIVAIFFNLEYWMVAQYLIPFIPSAVVCYFLFAQKQITKS